MSKHADDLVDRVRQASDIVALVRETVALKRAGSGYVGLCPFHKEKTPSFHVNSERQFYKCFGCGEAGDAFSFVMKTDGLAFGEALRMLAERARIEIPDHADGGFERGEKGVLYDINAWAMEGYHRLLVASPLGKAALDYLLNRGLTMDTIKLFRVGYSPDSWDTILKGGRKRKFSPEQMMKAGLLVSGERGTYDRFRNRVMFPILDVQDRVIGFGARCLDDSEPKYLNSPETPLFSKGRTLYAINRAKTALRERRCAVIVEGYMDAIMAHQYGVEWTLGVLGTALTSDHVRMLRRLADEAILLFDADNAGQSSAVRSVDAFAAEEMPVRVSTLPDGLDPDEFLRERGLEAFERCLAEGVDGVSFKLSRALEGTSGQGLPRAEAVDDVLATVAQMPNATARFAELRKVASRTGFTEMALNERMVAIRNAQRSPAPADAGQAAGPAVVARDVDEELLHVVLAHPETAAVIKASLDLRRLQNPQVAALLPRALELALSGQPCGAPELLARTVEAPLRALLERLMARDVIQTEDPTVWCGQLLREMEARAHMAAGQKLHHQIVAMPQQQNADDDLHARLAAMRDAQRMRGKLDLKREDPERN